MEKAAEITVSYKPEDNGLEKPSITSSQQAFNVLYPHFNSDTIHLQEQFLVGGNPSQHISNSSLLIRKMKRVGLSSSTDCLPD